MKKYLFHLFLILIYSNAFSQKRDNIWPLGYYSALVPTSEYYYLDFSNGFPDTVSHYRKMPFNLTDASICDTAGNLLFYTNGTWIANTIGDTMQNSQGFNPGWATNYYYTTGIGIVQGAMFLPFNDTSQFYYLVYESAEQFINIDSAQDSQPFHLTYSVIDGSLDSNRGAIISLLKDINVINDTLIRGRITACKHANGRDWWVVVHRYYSDIYYKLLFTPNGVLGPYSQQIGTLFPAKILTPFGYDDFDVFGGACFSPDGSKYITVGPSRVMEVLDFDRCTGLFSNHQTVNVPTNPGYDWALGCSFSPDSRYIYTNTYMRSYQYDSYAPVIDSSGILIAVYDSFMDPWDTWYFQNQIGPDGKIYISTFNGSYSMHVIEDPDSSGVTCNFNPHSLHFPYIYTGVFSVPNFPNYRLGKLIGSPCDTLTSIAENVRDDLKFKILPNPNDGNFIINYELPQNKSGTFEMFDVNGRKVYSQNLPLWSTMQMIHLPEIANGIFNCVITSGDERVRRKVAVVN